MVSRADVMLWGRRIGAVGLAAERETAVFEYDDAFIQSGIEVSPIHMPLRGRRFAFPQLPAASFHGLPGLLADALPDRYGNALINAWLAQQGRAADSMNAVERLCYVGRRGMGALEFLPATGPSPVASEPLDVGALRAFAGEVLSSRTQLHLDAHPDRRTDAFRQLLSVGTSAGGARAKAIIAWNPLTNEVRSGQVDAPAGFEHWLLKFDGVDGNRDKELVDPTGFGALEYAYHLMATAAGVEMTPCQLLEEGPRRHFMTRRFDRTDRGAKVHMQTLAGLAHLDFNAAGAHSYEQALRLCQRLNLPKAALEQLFRRMVFNIFARNQDDHVKNIAFLMDRRGRWSLAPAYDVTYSYNPSGRWTARHQMTLGGKRDDFSAEDFRACGRLVGLKRGRAAAIMNEVATALRRWPEFADAAGVAPAWAEEVRRNHRERGAGDIIDSSSGRTVSFPAAAAVKRRLPTRRDGPDQG